MTVKMTVREAKRIAACDGEAVRLALLPPPAPSDSLGIAVRIISFSHVFLRQGWIAPGDKPRVRVRAVSVRC